MLRLFSEHALRQVRSLDGLWQLQPQHTDRIYHAMVPGVWEQIPGMARFRGIAAYTRTVDVPRRCCVLLRFGGASHTADVYWDGEKVGHHYNAFTGFDVLVPSVCEGSHELRVVVDNRLTEASTLHVPNDYFTYGGLNRPVEIHFLSGAYIRQMAFHATEDPDGFTAHVRVTCSCVAGCLKDAQLQIRVAGHSATAPVPTLKAGEEAVIDVAFSVGQPARWDIGEGRLHLLACTLTACGEPVDDLIDRIGFRTVKLDGERILLNGRRVRIKGVNRHEDHPQFGCALPVEAMVNDLNRLLDLGGNSIRTCHYPNDPRFLDLCDEMGVLVWEEHHARALDAVIFHSELFEQQCEDCNREMIAQHVSHPCIYVWGLLNECESETKDGRTIYEKQIAQLRALDPTRPISFASCRLFTDLCMDLVDLCAVNIYPGWYTQEDIPAFTEKLLTWLDGNGAGGKPILITEVGAGGIYGFHDPLYLSKWSEERQAEILSDQLTSLTSHPRLSGTYVWQFADVRVSEEWAMQRPKTINNKGLMDGDRHPKMSYAAVRAIYSALPSLD